MRRRTAEHIWETIERLESAPLPGRPTTPQRPTLHFDVVLPGGTNIILERFPDLLGIYNIGSGTRGIAAALKESGVAGLVIFVGHDLTRFTRQYLIEGVMDAVINQDVAHEATGAIQHLLVFHDRPLPSSRPGPPRIEIFVRENMP